MTQVSGAITLEMGSLDFSVTQQVIAAISPVLERIEAKIGSVPGGELLGPRQTVGVLSSHLPAGVGSVGCPTPEDVAGYLTRYLTQSGYALVKVTGNG